MKKFIISLLCLALIVNPAFAQTVVIDELKGLQRKPQADRIQDGAHSIFQNVYINYGNIENVKGRDRLNTTAHSDTTVNGFTFYTNTSGVVTKLIVAESANIVSYDMDGTNRTVIATVVPTGFDAVQIGTSLYMTTANGIYKWTGTGSATLLVAPTASINLTSVSATYTPQGNLTTGNDAIVFPTFGSTDGYWRGSSGSGGCTKGYTYSVANDQTNWCSSLLNVTKSCATTTTYCYKATQYNSITGIESEAGAASCSSSYYGKDYVVYTKSDPFPTWSSSDTTCASTVGSGYASADIQYTNAYNNSSVAWGTVNSPFNKVKLYRTVASGGEYYLVGIYDPSVSTNEGKSDVSLASPLDTTIDMIAVPAYRYIEEYKGTIFVAQDDTIKFTRLPVSIIANADTYWLDSDELQITGQITGMVKASDSLLIFTKNSIYQVTGFGVTSFRLTPIVQGIGAISDDTIETDTNGDIIFSAGTEGIYKLAVGQQPIDSLSGAIIDNKNSKLTKLSAPYLDEVIRGTDSVIDLNPADYPASHAYYDRDFNRYFLYVGQECLMYDNTNGQWSYLPATKMKASIYTKSNNSAGSGIILDDLGFFYANWTGYENNAQVSGTNTGNPTSSTNNTLVCSTCSFNTTGSGLTGIWVFVNNENGEYRRISSNTSTTLTVDTNWTTNPITDDKFYIGWIHAKWTTKQYSLAKVPAETLTTHLYINHNKSDSSQIVTVRSFQKKSSIAVNEFDIDMSTALLHSINTRMRSGWIQYGFTTEVYNSFTAINPPIDIISYALEAEEKEGVD
jgi:hypothetical protein